MNDFYNVGLMRRYSGCDYQTRTQWSDEAEKETETEYKKPEMR